MSRSWGFMVTKTCKLILSVLVLASLLVTPLTVLGQQLSWTPETFESSGEQQLTATPAAQPDATAPVQAMPPKNDEPSRAESFFAQPSPYLGSAVSGSRLQDKVEQDEAALQQDEDYARLIDPSSRLPLKEKTQLFQSLPDVLQKRYLRSLSLAKRQKFLSSFGESEQWYGEDFQVVEVSRNLEQFGYDFFSGRDGSFSPNLLAPVGPDYIVGPGDELIISLWGSLEGQYSLPVDRNGEITLPKVGSISIWGQSFAEVKETLKQKIALYYKDFDLNLSLGALRSFQVFVVGEVNHPGTYNLSSLSTALTALVEAGGLAKTGSLRNVQLRRQGNVVATIDFYDFFLSGNNTSDRRLQAGDTIFVPIVGPLVGVGGDIRRPAIYEMKQGEVLSDVLSMAGGFKSTAYLGRVQVERVKAHESKEVIDLNLTGDAHHDGDLLKVPVKDGDFVQVSPISPQLNQYIRLAGYVAHPGRYQFKAGMRVADLFQPYDNLLPNYYPHLAEILRIPSPASRPEKIAFDLGLALSGDPKHNHLLSEFDEVRVFSRVEMEETPQVSVTGAVLKPGSYRFFDHMSVRELISSAGNLKRGAYLAEAEITRYQSIGRESLSERLKINLGQALRGDPEHNLELQPDDHLIVRLIPDYRKKRVVKIQGKVLFPGIYTITPGETMSSVLERAGGFADGAYLRGAMFTRESVRVLQRKRMEKLIQQQEQKIIQVSAEIAQGAMSDQDVAAAEALLASRKEVLGKLADAPITGRMIVHLAPLATFAGSEFDVELVDGDEITIPENPRSVTVMGEVYNPNSFTYQPTKTADFYLSRVGGVTENANDGEMFIVRADGSVQSRQQSGSGFFWNEADNRWESSDFFDAELFPGDTILVPQEFRRLDVMREVKDLTTILYQMALGAAAVASF